MSKFAEAIQTSFICLLAPPTAFCGELPNNALSRADAGIKRGVYLPFAHFFPTFYKDDRYSASDSSGMRTAKPKTVLAQTTEKMPSFSLYPNPARGYITIDYSLPEESGFVFLEVYAPDGRKTERRPLDIARKSVTLSLQDWNSGIYAFSFVVNGKRYGTTKVIVVR